MEASRQTIQSQKELIKMNKEDGYAIEDEEFQTGLFCIGIPIIDYKGRSTAAISTTIPKYRVCLNSKRKKLLHN